jgi:branched-chain amino acid aminotransferase
MAVVNIDGRVYAEHDARISVFDHGFLYGEGVYETLRTYNRGPFLYDRHVQRLRASARMIALPVPFSDAELLARIGDTILALDEHGEVYLRILLTRGVGELSYDPAACSAPTTVIIVKPHVDPPAEAFERGIRISLVATLRNHPGSLNPLIKSNNLLNNALAMQEAYQRGGEEALMRNYRGELAECSQSNFFLVRDGAALTPPLDAGLLAGVTRAYVFDLGHAIGIPVRDAVLRETDLDSAEEAFITSTTRELMPVVQIDERRIGRGLPGPITRRLLEEFRLRANEVSGSIV